MIRIAKVNIDDNAGFAVFISYTKYLHMSILENVVSHEPALMLRPAECILAARRLIFS